MPALAPAVATVIRQCLNVGPGENVVVVADGRSRAIGEALQAEAARAGADAVLALMDERREDGEEPPPGVAAAMRASDVFIAPTTRSLSHTTARKEANRAGARGATMPGVTEDMLARVMAVDFARMAARSQAVAELLSAGRTARVSCPRGTELTLELGRRSAVSDDGRLTAPGAFGNLPCGEGFISPTGGEGRVVATSLATLGISDDPAVLTVSDGRLVGGARGLGPEFFARLEAHGAPGRNLAELGVGTNDRAQLTGNVLEDEKILGTVHVAFGRSLGFGGTVEVPIHLDVVIVDASLEVDGRPVLTDGRFVLDLA
jgi:leucyl aminopeptidase (aminopeptidase T)